MFSVCWESNFLTHGWRSVPVVVQKQLLGSGVAFELESKHFYGFAFKVLYSRPDSDKGCRLWSVSWNRFLQVDEYISLSRICDRSEEHTSELQSLTNLVCRLLLE